MSGPPYPHPNPPINSNAIGQFVIGVSPLGDLRAFDVWATVLNQYANSTTLTDMIVQFGDCVDQVLNLQSFFDLIWNIETAEGYGLDVWGRILGISRTVHLPNNETFLGFQEAIDDTLVGFNQAPFFSGQTTTTNFDLSDSSYRTVLFVKALTNIFDGSAADLNQILLTLFPNRGNCFIRDNLDMTMTYVFNFLLSPVELTIVGLSGALPKLAGVSFDIDQALL